MLLSNGQFIKIPNRLLTSIMAPFNFPLVKRNDGNSYLVVTEIVDIVVRIYGEWRYTMSDELNFSNFVKEKKTSCYHYRKPSNNKYSTYLIRHIFDENEHEHNIHLMCAVALTTGMQCSAYVCLKMGSQLDIQHHCCKNEEFK